MVGNVYTKFYIVSTLTVVVATLNVNKLKMIVGNVYSMFNSVDTNGRSSNAYCKQAKRWLEMCTLSSIVSTLTIAVAALSVNKLK